MRDKIVIDFEKSNGSQLFDKKEQRFYLDFHNHYSSLPLGYNHPALCSEAFDKEMLKVGRIKTARGVYDSQEGAEFLDKFKSHAVPKEYEHLHFASTGSLAVEAAIKVAWGHSDFKKSHIVCMQNSFHGLNSFGNYFTDRGSWMARRLEGVPKTGWVLTANSVFDLGCFLETRNDKIAGVIVEPIQCTYGDRYYENQIADYWNVIKECCVKYNVPLIFDEVQTGFGATGNWWYHQMLKAGDKLISPDIVIFGKKAQVSGVMVKKEFGKIFSTPEKLSVTYDGDLLDMVRCKYIIDAIVEDELLLNVKAAGILIQNILKENSRFCNVRGHGGIIAFDLNTSAERDKCYKHLLDHGLLCNSTSYKTIRLRPNLAITQDEVDIFRSIIRKCENF
ncbi:MAG TPA: aminotransferase class III-fold pyridoxal phosphate-dependent enzyme [Anaerovoracaceae bacterium]|nr:aminotransferase class III-fold pyridoxal phosphate-dependent enzyme [Anaerovoracaceae bacterium]